MFKILNGYENIDSNIFFEIKESKITRGHNYTLVKKQSRLDVRKYSFSQRTINVWNNLSTDCDAKQHPYRCTIEKYAWWGWVHREYELLRLRCKCYAELERQPNNALFGVNQ